MLLSLVTLILILLVLFLYIQYRKPKNYPPGPPWIPIVGHLYTIKNLSRSLGGQHFAFEHLAGQLNTNVIGLKLGNQLTVIVLSYPLVKEILTRDVFEGRPDNFFMRLRTMGTRNGITGTDGDLWRIQRSFVVKHLRNFGFGGDIQSSLIKDEVEELIKVIPSSGTQIKTLLAPSVINIFWKLVSSSRLTTNDNRVIRLISLLSARSKAFDMAGGTLNIFPWLRFIMPEKSGYKLICEINDELRELFMETIQEHREVWNENKTEDLIDIFIKEIRSNSPTFSEEQLVMVMLDLFIAGSQTTSTTLDFAFMIMIIRPDIQQKIQFYIDSTFGENETINYSDRHRVPYIEAFIMEVIRYFVITPVIGPRRALCDTELHGYRIPKNTTILLSLYSLYYDKAYWTDPELFRPERFIDNDGKLIFSDRLIPFSLGRRRCLGEVVARQCLFNFFTEIIRRYEITLQPGYGMPSLIPQQGIVVSPQPYQARFTKRLPMKKQYKMDLV
ncbi:hypothetical protein WA026_023448 [Henosepilachna vigintioctopunctata]|uniref:Cytochrome P450 n=1 Tax=Henosepilachna vigintioctopunctata TaxID=420089 RepID=A0AAW1UJE4_9CUCU